MHLRTQIMAKKARGEEASMRSSRPVGSLGGVEAGKGCGRGGAVVSDPTQQTTSFQSLFLECPLGRDLVWMRGPLGEASQASGPKPQFHRPDLKTTGLREVGQFSLVLTVKL